MEGLIKLISDETNQESQAQINNIQIDSNLIDIFFNQILSSNKFDENIKAKFSFFFFHKYKQTIGLLDENINRQILTDFIRVLPLVPLSLTLYFHKFIGILCYNGYIHCPELLMSNIFPMLDMESCSNYALVFIKYITEAFSRSEKNTLMQFKDDILGIIEKIIFHSTDHYVCAQTLLAFSNMLIYIYNNTKTEENKEREMLVFKRVDIISKLISMLDLEFCSNYCFFFDALLRHISILLEKNFIDTFLDPSLLIDIYKSITSHYMIVENKTMLFDNFYRLSFMFAKKPEMCQFIKENLKEFVSIIQPVFQLQFSSAEEALSNSVGFVAGNIFFELSESGYRDAYDCIDHIVKTDNDIKIFFWNLTLSALEVYNKDKDSLVLYSTFHMCSPAFDESTPHDIINQVSTLVSVPDPLAHCALLILFHDCLQNPFVIDIVIHELVADSLLVNYIAALALSFKRKEINADYSQSNIKKIIEDDELRLSFIQSFPCRVSVVYERVTYLINSFGDILLVSILNNLVMIPEFLQQLVDQAESIVDNSLLFINQISDIRNMVFTNIMNLLYSLKENKEVTSKLAKHVLKRIIENDDLFDSAFRDEVIELTEISLNYCEGDLDNFRPLVVNLIKKLIDGCDFPVDSLTELVKICNTMIIKDTNFINLHGNIIKELIFKYPEALVLATSYCYITSDSDVVNIIVDGIVRNLNQDSYGTDVYYESESYSYPMTYLVQKHGEYIFENHSDIFLNFLTEESESYQPEIDMAFMFIYIYPYLSSENLIDLRNSILENFLLERGDRSIKTFDDLLYKEEFSYDKDSEIQLPPLIRVFTVEDQIVAFRNFLAMIVLQDHSLNVTLQHSTSTLADVIRLFLQKNSAS